jgi:hypothetical protein
MNLHAAVALTRKLLSDLGGDTVTDWATNDVACWAKNTDLVGYLDEGRTQLCLRRPIVDATSTLTQVTALVSAGGLVPLDGRILAVVSVREVVNDEPLRRLSMPLLNAQQGDWRADTGVPWAYTDTEADGQLRLVPVPVADVALRLVVHRGPLTPLSWTLPLQEIAEIPAYLHQSLPYWAAKRALETRDEVAAPGLAKSYEQEFLALAGPTPTLKQLQVRAHRAAGGGRIATFNPARRRGAAFF